MARLDNTPLWGEPPDPTARADAGLCPVPAPSRQRTPRL